MAGMKIKQMANSLRGTCPKGHTIDIDVKGTVGGDEQFVALVQLMASHVQRGGCDLLPNDDGQPS